MKGYFNNTNCYERFCTIERATQNFIFEDHQQMFHENIRGIRVFRFHDVAHHHSEDNRGKINCALEPHGFVEMDTFDSHASAWYSEKLLANVSWCEGSVYIVIYDNLEQYNVEREFGIKFYKENNT